MATLQIPGVVTLERLAVENEYYALPIIERLLKAGHNPLTPNSQKLFPYHFAQSMEVFSALTPPPVEPLSWLLTLAR
jgi:hypothetical protein